MNGWLSEVGLLVKEGVLMDTAIIEAPRFTQNKAGGRDPEMHPTNKDNQRHFGMEANIGVDARTSLTHRFTTTAANEHDIKQARFYCILHESFIFADTGYYLGAEKRVEFKDIDVNWRIIDRPGKVRTLKKDLRTNEILINIETMEDSDLAKAEHSFLIIKYPFGFTKSCYQCMAKNDSKLAMMFTLANIIRVRQRVKT